MFRTFIIVALLCLVNLVTGAEVRQKMIAGFEEENALAPWRWQKDPGPDWDVARTRISISDEWADEGKKSAKVEFLKYEYGNGPWRVINLPLRAVGANNWSDFDTAELTIYNPTQSTWRHHSRIRFRSGVVFLVVPEIKPGVNRYIFEIDKIRKMVNITNMPEFQIAWLEPHEDMVFYIDNIRLADYTEIRREELTKRLKNAANILSSKQKNLLERTARADRESLKQIQAEVEKAAIEFVENLGRATTPAENQKLIPLLSPLPMQNIQGVDGSPEARALAMFNPEAGRKTLQEKQTYLAQLNTLKKRLDALKSPLPFAIGRSDWPGTWFIDEVFSGRLDGDISIAGAGNETVPFQLMILARKDLKNVKVTISELKGAAVIPDSAFEIAPMGWRTDRATGKLLSDVLRPDIHEFPIRADLGQPVWVNLQIPPATPAGNYQAEITITADNQSMNIPLHLQVYNFSLPKFATLKTATHGSIINKETDYEFMAKHRFNPGNIYGGVDTLENMRKAHDMGLSFFNLHRFSDKGKGAFHEGEYSKARLRSYYKTIDAWMAENIKTDEDRKFLLENCFFYTFDEPSPEWGAPLEKLCADIKARYNNMRTAAAINMNMNPDIKNLDIVMATPGYLKRYQDQLPALKKNGKEFWWYNIFWSNTNATLIRAQYWATFLNPYIDGVLYYAVQDRSKTAYGPDLFHPAILDAPIRPDQYGIIRRNTENQPLSTLTMEYWREGIQDYEYLAMLRRQTAELAATGKNPALVKDAQEFLQLKGLAIDILDTSPEQEAEVTVAMSGLSTDMNAYIKAKQKAAALIEAVNKALK